MFGRRSAIAAVSCFAMSAGASALAAPVNLVANEGFSRASSLVSSSMSEPASIFLLGIGFLAVARRLS